MLKRLVAATITAGLVAATAPAASAVSAVRDEPQPTSPSFDDTVNSVVQVGGITYVGGEFDSVTSSAGVTKVRHGAAAFRTETGRILKWNPRVSGDVHTIAVRGSFAYLGGDFDRVRGKVRKNLARVDAGGKGGLKGFKHRVAGDVNGMSLNRKMIVLGGDFSAVDGKERHRLAAIALRTGRVKAWAPRAINGVVSDVIVRKQGVYVAGEFRELNGSTRSQRLALVTKKSGATVASFDPGVRARVFDINLVGDSVYAAVGGPAGGAVMRVDRGNGDTVWERRLDGDAQAVTVIGSEVFAGGHFARVCEDDQQNPVGGACEGTISRRQQGASFRVSDGVTGDWNPAANGELGIIALSGSAAQGTVVAGGDFTQLNLGAIDQERLAVFAPTAG